jgi:hypothetical protein
MTIKSGWLRTDLAEKRNEKKWNGKERSSRVQARGNEGNKEKHGRICTGMKQGWIKVDCLRPGWYYFGREKTSESNATRALKPV